MKFRFKLSLLLIALFMFSMLSTPTVIGAAIAPSDIVIDIGTAPVLLSVDPESPQYGYPVDSVINVTYMVDKGDVPDLRGSATIGLNWDPGVAMTLTGGNSTHDFYSYEITLTENGEFKAHLAVGDIWENAANHALNVEGNAFAPVFLNATGATTEYVGPAQGGKQVYYVEPTTTTTLYMSVINGNAATTDYYLMGDMNGWDHANRAFNFTYTGVLEQLTPGTNNTYWSASFTMTDARLGFKVGAFANWDLSESGDNNYLTNTLLKFSHPTLLDVVNADLEVARNDTTDGSAGAQYRTTIGENVTFQYMVYTTETCYGSCASEFESLMSTGTLELQGDDAGVSLDWDVNGQLPFTYLNTTHNVTLTDMEDVSTNAYTGDLTVVNASVAYFEIVYHVQVESLQFKGNFEGTWEGFEHSPNNVLVAGISWTSDVIGDIYNVGTFTLRFMAEFAVENPTNPDVLSFGVYNADTDSWTETNYTGSVGAPLGNGTWVVDMTINSEDFGLLGLGSGNVQAILYHFDLGLERYTKAYDPQGANNFDVLDGSATGDLTGTDFQGKDVTLDWTAGAGANTTLATASIDWDDSSAAESLTGASGTATHSFADEGEYNVTLTVTSAAGGSFSKVFTLTVDGTAPTVTLNTPTLDGLVASFTFSFSDDVSGVASAVIDFGDSTTTDVTSSTSVNHEFSEAGSFTVKLTVTDNAGNIGSAEISVTVEGSAAPGTPGFTAILSIISLVSVVAILRKRK